MKTLFLLRHAKSSWSDPELRDFDRPLNARGRGACDVMGPRIAALGIDPDRLLVSSAARTRETVDRLQAHAAFRTAPHYLDDLYGADVAELMRCLRALPATAGSAMVIGHNPGLQELALALAHQDDNPLLDRLETKFSTAGLARIDLDIDAWDGLRPGSGKLAMFEVPKDHKSGSDQRLAGQRVG